MSQETSRTCDLSCCPAVSSCHTATYSHTVIQLASIIYLRHPHCQSTKQKLFTRRAPDVISKVNNKLVLVLFPFRSVYFYFLVLFCFVVFCCCVFLLFCCLLSEGRREHRASSVVRLSLLHKLDKNSSSYFGAKMEDKWELTKTHLQLRMTDLQTCRQR